MRQQTVAVLCYPVLCNCGTQTTTIIIITTTATTFIPVHTMLVYVGSRDMVPLILNLGCRRRCLVRITSWTLYPFESTPVPINTNLGGPQSQAGYYREEKNI
jgi:hypothetical protein